MAGTDYLELAQLKTALGITHTNVDSLLTQAISAASRQIDAHCHDRFYRTDPTEKKFRAEYPDVLEVGSYAAISEIAFDMDDDGTFETVLDDTDWQAEPSSIDSNKPYTRIVLLTNGAAFPGSWRAPYYSQWPVSSPYGYAFGWNGSLPSRRSRVRVTAEWGWPEVPSQVVQACQILAIAQYKSKDITGGVAGSTAMATGSFGAKRDILINPNKIDPMAADLLSGLKRVIIA